MLVELDGADYGLLLPMVHRGMMPNLGRLVETSALAELRPIWPANRAVAKATLAAGCGPAGHGVLDDFYLDHWQGRVLAQSRRPLRCPVLADLVTAASPEAPSVRVSEALPRETLVDRGPACYDELCRRIAWTQTAMYRAVAEAEWADRASPWRLLEVRFGSLEALARQLWHLLGVGDGPGGNGQWTSKAQEIFRTLDECLGDLVALADRRHAAVAVVSAHGPVPLREKIAVSELLGRRDLLHLATGVGAIGYRVAHARWKLRRWWCSERAGRSAFGILPVDWRRSRAVTLHGRFAALAYLNTPERFGTRVLDTAAARERAEMDTMAAFAEAIHPVTHEPLFDDVYRTADRYGCDPLLYAWPEVVAIPARGHLMRHRPDRRGQLVRGTASAAATRGGPGLFMLRAPGVVLGEPCEAAAMDVAPTLAFLLGLAPERTMTGRVLGELLAGPRAQGAHETSRVDHRRTG